MSVFATANVCFAMTLDLGTGVSPDQLDETTRELLAEILENRLAGIRLPEGAAPEGSKSGVATTIGTLLVSLAPTLVPKLLDLLTAWVDRAPRRRTLRFVTRRGQEKVVVELKAGGVDPTELARLLSVATPQTVAVK